MIESRRSDIAVSSPVKGSYSLTNWTCTPFAVGYRTMRRNGGDSGDSTISVIDTVTEHVTGTIRLAPGLGTVAIDPVRHSLYATDFSHGTGHTVWIIDTTTGTVTGTVGVGLAPSQIAVDTGTHRAYVTNAGNNGSEDIMSVIDTTSQQVTATIHVGPGPSFVAVDKGAHTAYVTNGQTGNNGYGSGIESVIDTRTLQVTATIDVGAEPTAMAVDEGTHTAYVANDGFGTGHTVTVIVPPTTTQPPATEIVTPTATSRTPYSPTTSPHPTPDESFIQTCMVKSGQTRAQCIAQIQQGIDNGTVRVP